ncbi:protein-glutamate O-methyltransferase CheR [Borrelia sp. P9F1]|uniref:CheR family methyltransferase n=1 Tax=Borrelia sp. P9F1 TaxID=3058374 RepID=UPI0026490561|nr:protein-glutamate O-methyltransferase CheR [Borrelia sp. P9F1]WKC57968.1 protein-glutamate O-methyltransferase CheR [Borrelia sp. P9F1]
MLSVSDELLLKFCSFVYENSGIRFDEKNKVVLKGRINDAMHELENVNTPSQLYDLILSDSLKRDYFLDLVTTNLTRFFRNEAHFQTFERFIVPNLVKIKNKENKKKIVVWSAGCSSGEEPYSLAFVLKSNLPESFDFVVIASDLSLKSLMIAREGYYSAQKCEHIPIKYKKYTTPHMDGYRVTSDIKKHIRFDYHNLNFESGFLNIDVVFCRNVLIYFDEKSKIQVLKKFYSSMSLKSYLFIGHSESLFGLDLPFKFLKTPWAIIYEKDAQSTPKAKLQFQPKYRL